MLWLTQSNPATLAQRLEQSGIPFISQPILKIEYTEKPPAPLAHSNLLITSAVALQGINCYTNHPLYCVGSHTAAKARQAGFNVSEAATVSELLKQLPQNQPLVYYRGQHITQAIQHPYLTEHIVYEAKPQKIAFEFYNTIRGIVLCSQRGAKFTVQFLERYEKFQGKKTIPAIFCLSESIAKTYTLHRFGVHVKTDCNLQVAEKPTINALLDCLEYDHKQ